MNPVDKIPPSSRATAAESLERMEQKRKVQEELFATVLNLREKEKKTFNEISKIMERSHASVSRLHYLAVQERNSKEHNWMHGLSIRARQVLWNVHIESREALIEAVKGEGGRLMMKYRNCGAVTYMEFCRWLGIAGNGAAGIEEVQLPEITVDLRLHRVNERLDKIDRRLDKIHAQLDTFLRTPVADQNNRITASLNATNSELRRLVELTNGIAVNFQLKDRLLSLSYLTEGLSLVDIHNLCLAFRASKPAMQFTQEHHTKPNEKD